MNKIGIIDRKEGKKEERNVGEGELKGRSTKIVRIKKRCISEKYFQQKIRKTKTLSVNERQKSREKGKLKKKKNIMSANTEFF